MKPNVYCHYTGMWAVEIGADVTYFDTWREAYTWAFYTVVDRGTARLRAALRKWAA